MSEASRPLTLIIFKKDQYGELQLQSSYSSCSNCFIKTLLLVVCNIVAQKIEFITKEFCYISVMAMSYRLDDQVSSIMSSMTVGVFKKNIARTH